MVQRMMSFDDFDGSTDAQTVRYGYGGHTYEIDLSEEHLKELDQLLSRYIEHSRRVDEVKPERRGRPDEGARRSPEELRAIRQWAREQGLQVSDRGRIAADIVAKYDASR
jgi:nucleoid-associated protein Lsr2